MRLKQTPLVVGSLVLALALSACAGSATPPAAESSAAASLVAEASQIIAGGLGGTSAAPAASVAASAEASPAASAEASVATSADASPAAAGGAAQTSPAASGAPAAQASAGQYVQTIRDRGSLICGVNPGLAGFSTVDASGNYVGFDVDFCKALAAVVLGDPNAVQYRPLEAAARFPALQTGEIDVLIRNTTWTLTRDTQNGGDFGPVNFYDGQGMMVRAADNISSLEDMGGASICVQSGTTTELNLADSFRALGLEFTPVVFDTNDATLAAYAEGRCDGYTTDKSGLAAQRVGLPNPDEHVILDVTMSKEPLAPMVLQGDPQWADIVNWTVYGLITAEEEGITQENVESFLTNEDPTIRRLLGVEGELGAGLGISNDFVVQALRAVGNYGEIYARHLGPETPLDIPRGPNALYTEGGLLYAPPFR